MACTLPRPNVTQLNMTDSVKSQLLINWKCEKWVLSGTKKKRTPGLGTVELESPRGASIILLNGINTELIRDYFQKRLYLLILLNGMNMELVRDYFLKRLYLLHAKCPPGFPRSKKH